MTCLQALADLLYSFAILRYDAQHMVDSILTRILFDLKHMSPASLSQLVYGLHLLRHRLVLTHIMHSCVRVILAILDVLPTL